MALLEVNDLRTYFYSDDGVARAVDGVSFNVSEGETVGLVGESGCGKSMTALSLMRLVPPNGKTVGGTVRFDGEDLLELSDTDVRRIRGNSLAMIFQDPMTSLNPVLTICRQISESLETHLQMDYAAARRRTRELLELVGIPHVDRILDAYPHQLSGGMRQRVMIAMALSCRPKLLLADEVTTALDVTIQAQILELLRSLAQEFQAAFLLITHDLGIIAGMAQRVNVMYAGKIVESADTGELFSNPRMPYTWGLLRSIPRIDEPRKRKLLPIEGMPPDVGRPSLGCRFEPRCRYRRDICRQSEPELVPVPGAKPGHRARCWGAQDVPEGGWLVGLDWRQEAGDARNLAEKWQSTADVVIEPSNEPAKAGE